MSPGGYNGDTIVSLDVARESCADGAPVGLGSVVVFLTTIFALLSSVSSGFAALVIVQAGVFAQASRVLVK